MKKERHLTKFCAHPGSYQTDQGKTLGWCKYCRLRAHGGVKYQDLKAEYEKDNTKLIKVVGYPSTFAFTVVEKLPPFISGKDEEGHYTCEMCDARNELLHVAMAKMRVDSPCHAYGDYVVEAVISTEFGEIWRLGS